MIINETRTKRGIQIAKRIMEELEKQPKDIHYLGYQRKATRASEIIANQPLVQEILSKHLGIKK